MNNRAIQLACLSVVLSSPTIIAEETSQKNILFIAVDDLKPLLGCYGDSLVKTPNINKLSSVGAMFSMAYCQQAVSGPTRASLLTGICPDKTRVWDLKTLIRKENPDIVTLPQHFKDNNYNVVGIGKIFDPRSVDNKNDSVSWSIPYINYNIYLEKGYTQPELAQYQSEESHRRCALLREEAKTKGIKGKKKIEEYVLSNYKPTTECADIPDAAYPDGAIAMGAVTYIKNYDKKSPFFLAVGFKKPHLPFCAPKKYWDLYKREEMPLATFREKAKNSPNFAYHQCGELKLYTDIPDIISFTDINNAVLPDSKAKELIHGYYACISYIDTQVGLVIDALQEKGMLENTIIVFWGDHGWHLGDHGLWNKHTNFEQATHVPLIIVDPSSSPKKINNPVEFLDIYPTLCDLAKIKAPSHLDGTSLEPFIIDKENKSKRKPYAVSQFFRVGKMGYSIRSSRYRYTIWVRKNKISNLDKVIFEELYDYKKDPNETVNVAQDLEYNTALKQMQIYWNEYKSNK